MKKISGVFILVFLFFCGLSPLCQAIEDEYTLPIKDNSVDAVYIEGVIISGQTWNKFTRDAKWGYLFGFEDGTRNTAIHFISDSQLKNTIQGSLPGSIEGGEDFEFLIQEIDKFYSDDRNRDIPINYVFLITRNRLLGTDETKIQRYIEYLRNPKGEDVAEIIELKTNK